MSYTVTELTRVEMKGAKPFILRPGHVIEDELARRAGLVPEVALSPVAAPQRPSGATPPRMRKR